MNEHVGLFPVLALLYKAHVRGFRERFTLQKDPGIQ